MLAAHYFRQMVQKLLWVANPTPENDKGWGQFFIFSLPITLSNI